MTDKVCTRCRVAKPRSEFSRERLMADGLRNWCKACKRLGPMTFRERFDARIEKTATCWLWTGSHSRGGYGQVQIGRRSKNGHPSPALAHRVAYELFVGPIPEGLTIDHLCRVRHCVNPAHLEPVTRGENTLRGNGACAVNARKTHCKRGHLLDGDNVRLRPTGRECRACADLGATRRRAA